MKKLYFAAPGELEKGIELLLEEIGFELAEDGLPVEIIKADEDKHISAFTLKDNRGTITYSGGRSRFYRALGKLCEAISDGKKEASAAEYPSFTMNGAMFDMSRNAVMRPETVKRIMTQMAVMGLNTFMLYTEDTYEVKGRPYFGHMRGRYTFEEIKDMDSFAIELGIELIPCIQLLAHLETHTRWVCARSYTDYPGTLLTGAKETYQLIDDIIKSVSEAFTSRRVHIGMDEAHYMGRGVYLDRNGHKPQIEVFCEHMDNILPIIEKYGLKPMMWSDMYFRTVSKTKGYYDETCEFTDEIKAIIPSGVSQVYWDYYTHSTEKYDAMIDKHFEISEDVIFAGGVWQWIGYCPHYQRTLKTTIPALKSCIKKGIREVFATVWHNGAESTLAASLPGLLIYAELDYNPAAGYDEDAINKRSEFLLGLNYHDILALEEADKPDNSKNQVNSARWLTFNDPLIGLLDRHVEGMDTQDFYAKQVLRFENAGPKDGFFAPVFDLHRALVSLLELKADFGVRLKAAYNSRDMGALRGLCDDALIIIARLGKLRDAHRDSWMYYNKPFGFEVMDAYYGTLRARFETVIYRVEQLIAGNIDKIEELDEDRLWYDGRERAEGAEQTIVTSNRFWLLYSPNVIYTNNRG